MIYIEQENELDTIICSDESAQVIIILVDDTLGEMIEWTPAPPPDMFQRIRKGLMREKLNRIINWIKNLLGW